MMARRTADAHDTMHSKALAAALLYCRAGFEKECASEVMEKAVSFGITGYIKARPLSGFVLYCPHDAAEMPLLADGLDFSDLVFARQLLFCRERMDGLPPADRVTPLVEAAKQLGGGFDELLLETADTNEAKELSGFCRKLEPHLRRGLQSAGLLGKARKGLRRLHFFFLDSSSCHPGYSIVGRSSPWPMGIPRLRVPREAPSRSVAKLIEAFMVLLTEDEQRAHLKPGMSAVDLGAAPGGWSWQLARKGVRVTAVDNGPMDKALLTGGLVEHVRIDGFTYQPPRPVDWLVCDMVEQPARIAALVAQWLTRGWCREAMFNLKLPMNKRYEELKNCRKLIDQRLRVGGVAAELRIKQLYHDREEVTAYLRRVKADQT